MFILHRLPNGVGVANATAQKVTYGLNYESTWLPNINGPAIERIKKQPTWYRKSCFKGFSRYF